MIFVVAKDEVMSDEITSRKMVIIFALCRYIFKMILLLILTFYFIILMKIFMAASGWILFSEGSWVWPSFLPIIGDQGLWRGLLRVWFLILLTGCIGVPAFYILGTGIRSGSSTLTEDAP